MRRADLEATMADSLRQSRGAPTNNGEGGKWRSTSTKRKREDAHAIRDTRFFIRSSRGSQLRAAKRHRKHTETVTKTPSARQRIREAFQQEAANFAPQRSKHHISTTDSIQHDMLQMTRSLGERSASLYKYQQQQQQQQHDKARDETQEIGDPDDVIRGMFGTNPAESESETSEPEESEQQYRAWRLQEEEEKRLLFESLERDRPLVELRVPSQPPSVSTPAPVSKTLDYDLPWLQTCRDLDQLRGRVPDTDPLLSSGSTAAEQIRVTASTDPRGPDPAHFVTTQSDTRPECPPLDSVVCRVQNWVVRLDCVVDRYSVKRAVAQARKDLEMRHRLRQKGSPVSPNDYDRLYVAELQETYGSKNLQGEWTQPAHDRKAVPIWDRSVPRVHDLVRCLNTTFQAHRDGKTRPRTDWCDNAEMNYPPALDLHSLAFRMLPHGARYDIHNFAALKLSTVNPKAACLVYASSRAQAGSKASARVVCTGAKTPEEVAWTLKHLETNLIGAGAPPIRIDRDNFKVSNVVASALLPYYVDMDNLVRQCRLYCTYTPAVFPGATLRLPQLGKMTILVFTTKLIITGSRNKSMLLNALRLAVQITWRARYLHVETNIAQSMLRAPQRVLMELLDDAAHLARNPGLSPWALAIRHGSSVAITPTVNTRENPKT